MNIKANNSISQANGHVLTPVLACRDKEKNTSTYREFISQHICKC